MPAGTALNVLPAMSMDRSGSSPVTSPQMLASFSTVPAMPKFTTSTSEPVRLACPGNHRDGR